jgi:hypothetical protein
MSRGVRGHLPGTRVEIVESPFLQRWVVEGSFGWQGKYSRRLTLLRYFPWLFSE